MLNYGRLVTFPKKYSNSFDIFLRGEEILSGGQRIHLAHQLEDRLCIVSIIVHRANVNGPLTECMNRELVPIL